MGRVGGGGGSEVSLLLGLCAKVLLVLGAAHLSHLRVLWHVRQRVGADDVPAEEKNTHKKNKTRQDVAHVTELVQNNWSFDVNKVPAHILNCIGFMQQQCIG